MANQVLNYRPARTVAAISGTITERIDASGKWKAARAANVVLTTEADPEIRWHVDLKHHFRSDQTFDLRLAADERLAGATSTSTGIGAELLAAGVRIAALAAAAVTGFRAGDAPVDVDAVLQRDQPALSDRLRRYRAIVRQLDNELEQTVGKVNTADEKVDAHMDAVQTELTAASQQLAVLEASFQEWLEKTYPPWVQHYSFPIPVDKLPDVGPVPKPKWDSIAEFDQSVQEAAKLLGIFVGRVGDTVASAPSDPSLDEPKLVVRFPRRVVIAVYEATDPDKPTGEYRLRNVSPAWVVDRYSLLGEVAIESHLFKDNGATVEFGDAGTLTHISNSETSEAGSIAKALSTVGEAATDSLEQGAKIAAALKPQHVDPEVRALTDQVMLAELQARLAKAQREIALA